MGRAGPYDCQKDRHGKKDGLARPLNGEGFINPAQTDPGPARIPPLLLAQTLALSDTCLIYLFQVTKMEMKMEQLPSDRLTGHVLIPFSNFWITLLGFVFPSFTRRFEVMFEIKSRILWLNVLERLCARRAC